MISRIIDEKNIRAAARLINSAREVVVVTHMSPDGDAVGSSLAAMHVLTDLGKKVKVVVPDAPLGNLRHLPGADQIIDAGTDKQTAVNLLIEAELVLCLDFNEPSRVGRLQEALEKSKAPKILIDHHLHPDLKADALISYPDMAATAYLLFRFFCRLELFNAIGRDAATCLLAGIMTDTGNLAYNASDPEMYTVVAELLRKGADKERLYQELFNTFSENCLRLRSYAIGRKMEVFHQDGAALITLTRDELNRFHYTKGDTEGLVNIPLAIPGVYYSAFMRQESDCIRVSMRSIGSFPVNKICAEHFDGGGHLNAAGGDFHGTMEEAAQYFRSILKDNKKYLQDLNNGK